MNVPHIPATQVRTCPQIYRVHGTHLFSPSKSLAMYTFIFGALLNTPTHYLNSGEAFTLHIHLTTSYYFPTNSFTNVSSM